MLTAGVLFVFATAQPKGFALTLILGVLVSMLTAVLFTRAMLGVLAGFAFFSKPAFMGVRTSQIETETVAESRDRREPQAPRGGQRHARHRRRGSGRAGGSTGAASTGAGSGRRTSTSRKKKKRR